MLPLQVQLLPEPASALICCHLLSGPCPHGAWMKPAAQPTSMSAHPKMTVEQLQQQLHQQLRQKVRMTSYEVIAQPFIAQVWHCPIVLTFYYIPFRPNASKPVICHWLVTKSRVHLLG